RGHPEVRPRGPIGRVIRCSVMPHTLGDRTTLSGLCSCDAEIIGAGLAGLCVARTLTQAGLDVLVLEARTRVGGRVFTEPLGAGGFIDHGGQWISPGQDRIAALAAELGVALFPSWDAGLTVHWERGVRSTGRRMFPPGREDAEAAVREGA